MMFVNRKLLFILLTQVAISIGCSDIDTQSIWMDTPIIVDGKANDWNDLPWKYIEDAGVSFSIVNNAKSLFLSVKFRDQRLLRAVSSFGLTIWLDDSRSRNKEFGIKYNTKLSLRRDAEKDIRQDGNDGKRTSEYGMYPYNPPAAQLMVVRKGESDEVIPLDPFGNSAAQLGDNDGVYLFELGIPLSRTDSVMYGIGAEPGDEIAIGIEFGGPNRDEMRSGRKMKSGGGLGGGSGPGGGGMRDGGRKTGGIKDATQMSSGKAFWITVSLADLPEYHSSLYQYQSRIRSTKHNLTDYKCCNQTRSVGDKTHGEGMTEM